MQKTHSLPHLVLPHPRSLSRSRSTRVRTKPFLFAPLFSPVYLFFLSSFPLYSCSTCYSIASALCGVNCSHHSRENSYTPFRHAANFSSQRLCSNRQSRFVFLPLSLDSPKRSGCLHRWRDLSTLVKAGFGIANPSGAFTCSRRLNRVRGPL